MTDTRVRPTAAIVNGTHRLVADIREDIADTEGTARSYALGYWCGQQDRAEEWTRLTMGEFSDYLGGEDAWDGYVDGYDDQQNMG